MAEHHEAHRKTHDLVQTAFKGDVAAVARLVEEGADLRAYSDGGLNALHAAIENNQLQTVELLLQLGADVEQTTRDGWFTPLLHAIEVSSDAASQLEQARSGDMIDLLLRHGASPTADTAMGPSPLEFARQLANPVAEALLRVAAAPIELMLSGETVRAMPLQPIAYETPERPLEQKPRRPVDIRHVVAYTAAIAFVLGIVFGPLILALRYGHLLRSILPEP
ncbi:MAG TPA: ankyrin repeat domain-containing protein [Tepidisphaeraceae bacterium]|jgi:hypothetical protein|nr:ankyrin repeat domain-containing protein [Tepidisphaeraceae bacterium]